MVSYFGDFCLYNKKIPPNFKCLQHAVTNSFNPGDRISSADYELVLYLFAECISEIDELNCNSRS